MSHRCPPSWMFLWLVLVMVVPLWGCGADPLPDDGSAATPPERPARAAKQGRSEPMPKALRAATIAARQRGAPAQYNAVALAPGGWMIAENEAHRFSTVFDGRGALLSSDSGAWTFSMRASAVGCATERKALGGAEPAGEGHRIRYERGELEEWYVNGPMGLEQGFVLPSAPSCAGTKVVAIELGGGLRAELVDPDGDGRGEALALRDEEGRRALRYSDLYVKDASGKELSAWLSLEAGEVVIHVDDAGAQYPVEIDPLVWGQQAKLLAGDGAMNDFFGDSVALSGDMALVGAANGDGGAVTNQGSAYVFVRSGVVWTEQQKLTASDGATGDYFGTSVALSGDTALVGAFLDDVGATNQGSAYVFVRSGVVWTEQQKLTASDGAGDDRFGDSVALSGDTALVGAFFDDVGATDQGSAYVFVRSGVVWTEQQKLTASDGAGDDQFGDSVALSGDTALVGASLDDVGAPNQGSAYVFVRSGVVWTEQQKLTASDGAGEDGFGNSVALSEDTALVAANADDVGAPNQGSAYVFVRSGVVWTEQQKLTASDGAGDDLFGLSVALSGDTALVAAHLDDVGAPNQGSAYVFVRSGVVWTEQQKLTASDGAGDDFFGRSVALSGDTALVGALHGDGGANAQGSAYVFIFALSQGSACAIDAECVSGFCVDSVCCDVACGGGNANDCEVCSAALGSDADGTCTPLTGPTCGPGGAGGSGGPGNGTSPCQVPSDCPTEGPLDSVSCAVVNGPTPADKGALLLGAWATFAALGRRRARRRSRSDVQGGNGSGNGSGSGSGNGSGSGSGSGSGNGSGSGSGSGNGSGNGSGSGGGSLHRRRSTPDHTTRSPKADGTAEA